jgi:hypothetical protein
MKQRLAAEASLMGQRRIGCDRLRFRVMSAESAALLITSGITVGMSGFTGSGYPKADGMEFRLRYNSNLVVREEKNNRGENDEQERSALGFGLCNGPSASIRRLASSVVPNFRVRR